MGHEYFCEKAIRINVTMQAEEASRRDGEEDRVLLQIMKIPWLDRKRGCESVMWDTIWAGVLCK